MSIKMSEYYSEEITTKIFSAHIISFGIIFFIPPHHLHMLGERCLGY